MLKKKLLPTIIPTMLFASSVQALPFELPSMPFPTPGTDDVLFVVRNVTDNVSVDINDYWSNREIKRLPFQTVYKQSLMSTGGYKWISSFITVSVNGDLYTMASISGYKNFYSIVYTKIKSGILNKSYESVEDFVGTDIHFPNKQEIAETPEYFISSETFNSGSGTVISLCVSNKETYHDCRTQN